MLREILNLPKNLVKFVKSTFTELKYVKWIKGSDVIKYTIFLMLFLIFGSIGILLLDRLLLLIRSLIVPA
jgi:preprotein translocase subunit SecE